jgi:hypothetical protein
MYTDLQLSFLSVRQVCLTVLPHNAGEFLQPHSHVHKMSLVNSFPNLYLNQQQTLLVLVLEWLTSLPVDCQQGHCSSVTSSLLLTNLQSSFHTFLQNLVNKDSLSALFSM